MAYSRLQKLASYIRPHWKQSLLGIFTLLLVNGLGVYIPLLIRNGINDLENAIDISNIIGLVFLIFGLASLMWVIRMVSRILIFGVGRQVEYDLKQNIFEHLLTLEPAYFSNSRIGDLINRATSDVDNIRRLLGFAILSLANTLFAYALTLPVMLLINVRLTLLSISVYPVMLILVQVFSDKLRDQQMEVQEKLSNISDLLQEDMSGISLIKIYAQEENEQRAFERYNYNLFAANLSLAKTRNFLFPVLGGLASLSLLILLAVGDQTIAQGELNVGDFVALVLYIERLVFPTALLGFTITAYQRGEVSIDRIEAILSVKPKIHDHFDPIPLSTPVQGWLSATNLSYTYPGSKIPALDQVNFTIKPGEMVAIVGAIGSGKSTLANALPRLLDIDIDCVFLDGQDITQLRLSELRNTIAYVPQESFLFSTTIRENIRYGNPLADFSEIESAAKTAKIYGEIINFPQQYDTIVGERGITLSGGQRQRTALARALLVDAPVLILDDALSSVDNQTATEILQNLTTGTQRKTVVFISHQMSAAAKANRILVMDQGRIVQEGTHEQLVQQKGLYQSLWNQHQLEELLI
ncbi:ABC transporter ATP-binding protein [Limnoraphis robusta Tam1]|uniref:ABC transporter ATP-binding protein n=1 Tax=Limnoraphis robusta CCNP1315 TaxID=3110306 RepID=A0ABU5U703_9CYAN|nr:ABC transporter ATP-binding protein [Limnoraphis robusta]MEA5499212.1 ABC transporter ATP-binding protein [Limnoraphis robusta BA-68 BA1]MEA5522997.1 ABC transporter ATP-binding protein [Limnoraphis robusta CCNP1315]MEA5540667.1 ABC transporter ATP-binding protein [Limnoraphis robusta Tam1]MEA5545039.1 ABC transporter ATP-binding protein [Limnoraphis robusta CCNP1324]